MNDRKLLELAAKAVGNRWNQELSGDHGLLISSADGPYLWRPLTDDGDALRLAVKLEMEVYFGNDDGVHAVYAGVAVAQNKPIRYYSMPVDDEPDAATRRAIVRAAAEIGKIKGEKR